MENDNLKKIDDILKRTNSDFTTAKQALDDANGDVLEAIILIENKQKQQQYQQTSSKAMNAGTQIMDQIKSVISKGNATKITIKKGNETIINLPVTAGIVGAFAAPFLSAAGITTALLTQCTVEITQADGKVIDVGKKFEEGVGTVKNTMEDVKDEADNLKNNISNEAEDLKYAFTQGVQNIKTTASKTTQDFKNTFAQKNGSNNSSSNSSNSYSNSSSSSETNNIGNDNKDKY